MFGGVHCDEQLSLLQSSTSDPSAKLLFCVGLVLTRKGVCFVDLIGRDDTDSSE